MLTLTTAPRFQIENAGYTGEDPDYRPCCTRCSWSWTPTKDDDPLGSRAEASRFAHTVHAVCRAEQHRRAA